MTQLMKVALLASMLALAACGDGDDVPDLPNDGMMDAGRFDAGPIDARVPDSATRDN